MVDYERIISEANRDKVDPEVRLGRVIPINFSSRHKEMLLHCKIEMQSKQVAISPPITVPLTTLPVILVGAAP